MQVNVEPIAQVIDDLAADLRRRADELERLAGSLRDTGDLDEAVAAVSVAVSTANLRLDLLLSRPIRELQRASSNGRPDADSLQS
jgi:HAMP domain-containing protein